MTYFRPIDIKNVKDFGAIGDGITNDTAAINQAINAASVAGGGTVILPGGHTFYVTHTTGAYLVLDGTTLSYAIELLSNIELRIDGKLTSPAWQTGTQVATIISKKGASNIRVNGRGIIQGGGGTGGEAAHHAIFIAASDDITISEIEIASYRGIGISFSLQKPSGSPTSFGCNRCKAFDTYIHDLQGNAISMTKVFDTEIVRNTILNNTQAGTGGAEAIIGTSSGTAAWYRVLIADNNIQNWGNIDVGTDSVTANTMVTVRDNIIVMPAAANASAIRIKAVSNVVVIGNQLDVSAVTQTRGGISCSDGAVTGATIADNTIKIGTVGNGILTQDSNNAHADITIGGNRISGANNGSDQAGIVLKSGTNFTVGHNTISGTSYGLYVHSTATDVSVLGNTLNGCVFLVNGSNTTLLGNTIRAGSNATRSQFNSWNGAMLGNRIYSGSTLTACCSITANNSTFVGNTVENTVINIPWLAEDIGANNNIFIGNIGIGTQSGNGYTIVGNNSIINKLTSNSLKTKTATYNILNNDNTILADGTTLPFALTLPTAVGITSRTFTIKRINSNSNVVAVSGSSSQTIDGTTGHALANPNDFITVVSDGANWKII